MEDAPDVVAAKRSGTQDWDSEKAYARFLAAERVGSSGHWRLDVATGQIEMSPGMFALTETVADNLPTTREIMAAKTHPEDLRNLEGAIDTAIREGRKFKCRYRAGVTSEWFEVRGDVERNEQGEVIAVIGLCNNVSELVAEEEERREAQKIYQVMAEEASAIISLHPPGGGAFFVSNSFERVHGLKATDVKMHTMFSRVHPDDVAEVTRLKRQPERGETISATYRTKHAKGHYFWIETTTRCVFDEQTNESLYVVASSRDVNERVEAELAVKAAQERAESANRAKSLFLANMSHELRTPLNAVIGFADVMRAQMFGPLGNERYGEYSELIYDSGQLLLDLISDILDMSKIEAGKFELHYEDVELHSVIAECMRLLAQRAARANLSLIAAPGAGPLHAEADRRAIKQILVNLISNAIKFTPPEGNINVTVSTEGDFIALAVSDEGIGIPEADLPRLGKPFEQVCDDPTLAKGGTGLGLALVRALAEKHGGSMKIDSAVGEGTTVTVRFPIRRSASAAA